MYYLKIRKYKVLQRVVTDMATNHPFFSKQVEVTHDEFAIYFKQAGINSRKVVTPNKKCNQFRVRTIVDLPEGEYKFSPDSDEDTLIIDLAS